jgi:putative colanic acid biosynthesis UDP-glucose lipid carrier transferase
MKSSTAQASINLPNPAADQAASLSVEHESLRTLVLPHQLPLDKKRNLFLKRCFDLFTSAFLIVFVLSWLLPLIALLIKLDSRGPVFFFQKRAAKNGKLFTCIKFRTMIVNNEADDLPAALDDKRITKLGRLLRTNHLDELPQLFNVLLGHMSVIGPRPHMISDNSRYEEALNFYNYRQKVKPGITGLAQVHGYVGTVNTIDCIRERVKKDIYYIHHWTFWLDAKIACRTLLRMTRIRKRVGSLKSEV